MKWRAWGVSVSLVLSEKTFCWLVKAESPGLWSLGVAIEGPFIFSELGLWSTSIWNDLKWWVMNDILTLLNCDWMKTYSPKLYSQPPRSSGIQRKWGSNFITFSNSAIITSSTTLYFHIMLNSGYFVGQKTEDACPFLLIISLVLRDSISPLLV